MSTQQKALARWTLIGLAASILISTLNVVAAGGLGISEIDSFNIWNPEIIAYWIGRAGLIPLVCIIVVAARTFKETGVISSISNVTAAVLITALVIGIGVVGLAASLPVKEFPFASGRSRADFVETASKACIDRQHAMPENQSVSDGAIRKFCACYANSLASTTTANDVRNSVSGSPSPTEVKRMTAAWQNCLQPRR